MTLFLPKPRFSPSLPIGTPDSFPTPSADLRHPGESQKPCPVLPPLPPPAPTHPPPYTQWPTLLLSHLVSLGRKVLFQTKPTLRYLCLTAVSAFYNHPQRLQHLKSRCQGKPGVETEMPQLWGLLFRLWVEGELGGPDPPCWLVMHPPPTAEKMLASVRG